MANLADLEASDESVRIIIHISVPRQHSGCVRWCFPRPNWISLAQYNYVASQLHHAYFERNAGPGGRFLKNEDNGFTFQGLAFARLAAAYTRLPDPGWILSSPYQAGRCRESV